MVAAVRPGEGADAVQLDTAAVLAAHVGASLDVALALEHERQSAVTDSLTGILNRRGIEERLEHALKVAQELRRAAEPARHRLRRLQGHQRPRGARVRRHAPVRDRAGARCARCPKAPRRPGWAATSSSSCSPARDRARAELGGKLRLVLAEGLTDAGFPLRVSAGISTYPFDGATPPALLRAADQALYAAKNAGKDRVASFADIARPDPSPVDLAAGDLAGGRRRPRGDGSVLADVVSASLAIDAEKTVDGVCSRLCKWLVFVVGATACSASRVVGDLLVDATEHALREVSLGDEASYRLSDFPVTAETLETGEPRTISFLDGDVDPAEAFILRELGMNAVLLLPLQVGGAPWGLVELYEMRLRRFTDDDLAVARFLVTQAERRLTALGADTAPLPKPRLRAAAGRQAARAAHEVGAAPAVAGQRRPGRPGHDELLAVVLEALAAGEGAAVISTRR